MTLLNIKKRYTEKQKMVGREYQKRQIHNREVGFRKTEMLMTFQAIQGEEKWHG